MMESVLQHWLIHHLLIGVPVAARLGGMVVALPALTGGMPARMRVVLVFSMTLVLLPTISGDVDPNSVGAAEYCMAVVRELIFGVVIGGVVALLITGVQLAGELIGGAAGLQIGFAADPTAGDASSSQLSRLLGLLVTAVLFAGGGHRLLIDALMNSFDQVPPLSVDVNEELHHVVIDHLMIGMETGLRIGAPVLACILSINLVVSVISRTMPQLNVLAIGLNLNVIAVLIVLAMTLGSAGILFERELVGAIQSLGHH